MEQYGVARRLLHKSRMTGDTLDVPRRAGQLTTYFLTDNEAITATNKRWDLISLIAKKLAAFIFFSNEIAEDAMIDIGADLMDEIAWNFAAVEDECCFLGDGTSKYGGIVGFGPAITTAFASGTGSPGLITGAAGSGSAWTSYTLGNFESLMAALPGFAWKRGRPTWFCTQQFYYGAMVPLAAAAGGNRISDIQAGAKENIFLGCPVEFTQVMTTAAGVSQIDCFLGDLGMAGEFGDRRQLTIATSTEFGFSSDQIAIRGIERFDINPANVGGHSAAAQAVSKTYLQDGTTNYAGPIVALKSYSS
jgi:HK97 family phage major capsid protein